MQYAAPQAIHAALPGAWSIASSASTHVASEAASVESATTSEFATPRPNIAVPAANAADRTNQFVREIAMPVASSASSLASVGARSAEIVAEAIRNMTAVRFRFMGGSR